MTLAQGQELRLEASELIPMHSGSAVAKGDGDFEPVISVTAVPAGDGQLKLWSIAVELGVLDGVAKDAVLGGGRLGLERRFGAKRLAVNISAGTGRASGMRENRVTADVLPSWWLGTGRFSAGLGLGLGAGTGIERIDGSGHVQWSGLAFASPTALVEVGLGHRFAMHASVELPLTLLRRDDRVTATALGAAWLGLARGF